MNREKEMALMRQIRKDKDLREKMVQSETLEDALKAVNESGLDFTLEELTEIGEAHIELHQFYQKMTQMATSTENKDEIPFAIVAGFVPGD